MYRGRIGVTFFVGSILGALFFAGGSLASAQTAPQTNASDGANDMCPKTDATHGYRSDLAYNAAYKEGAQQKLNLYHKECIDKAKSSGTVTALGTCRGPEFCEIDRYRDMDGKIRKVSDIDKEISNTALPNISVPSAEEINKQLQGSAPKDPVPSLHGSITDWSGQNAPVQDIGGMNPKTGENNFNSYLNSLSGGDASSKKDAFTDGASPFFDPSNLSGAPQAKLQDISGASGEFDQNDPTLLHSYGYKTTDTGARTDGSVTGFDAQSGTDQSATGFDSDSKGCDGGWWCKVKTVASNTWEYVKSGDYLGIGSAEAKPSIPKWDNTADAREIGQREFDVTAYYPCSSASACPIQGGPLSSVPGPDGKALVRTLDDYRLGNSDYVTGASDPRRYGETYVIPEITYKSAIDGQTYTLEGVPVAVHDTGDAFSGRPDKLDIATGVAQSDRQAADFAKEQKFLGDKYQTYTQYSALPGAGSAEPQPSIQDLGSDRSSPLSGGASDSRSDLSPDIVPRANNPRIAESAFGPTADSVRDINFARLSGIHAVEAGAPLADITPLENRIPTAEWYTDRYAAGEGQRITDEILANSPNEVGQAQQLADRLAQADIESNAYVDKTLRDLPLPPSASLSGEEITAQVNSEIDAQYPGISEDPYEPRIPSQAEAQLELLRTEGANTVADYNEFYDSTNAAPKPLTDAENARVDKILADLPLPEVPSAMGSSIDAQVPLPDAPKAVSEPVDSVVRSVFDKQIAAAQQQVSYAKDLLARSESPYAQVVAQTLLDDSNKRLDTVVGNSISYASGNANPELQKVIDQMEAGKGEGAASKVLTDFAHKANTDADAIAKTIQTSGYTGVTDAAKAVWDAGAWGLAKTTAGLTDTARNWLERADIVPGFTPAPERAIADAIDPYAKETKLVTDVAMVAPFAIGPAKSLINKGLDTAIETSVGAGSVAFESRVIAGVEGSVAADSAASSRILKLNERINYNADAMAEAQASGNTARLAELQADQSATLAARARAEASQNLPGNWSPSPVPAEVASEVAAEEAGIAASSARVPTNQPGSGRSAQTSGGTSLATPEGGGVAEGNLAPRTQSLFENRVANEQAEISKLPEVARGTGTNGALVAESSAESSLLRSPAFQDVRIVDGRYQITIAPGRISANAGGSGGIPTAVSDAAASRPFVPRVAQAPESVPASAPVGRVAANDNLPSVVQEVAASPRTSVPTVSQTQEFQSAPSLYERVSAPVRDWFDSTFISSERNIVPNTITEPYPNTNVQVVQPPTYPTFTPTQTNGVLGARFAEIPSAPTITGPTGGFTNNVPSDVFTAADGGFAPPAVASEQVNVQATLDRLANQQVTLVPSAPVAANAPTIGVQAPVAIPEKGAMNALWDKTLGRVFGRSDIASISDNVEVPAVSNSSVDAVGLPQGRDISVTPQLAIEPTIVPRIEIAESAHPTVRVSTDVPPQNAVDVIISDSYDRVILQTTDASKAVWDRSVSAAGNQTHVYMSAEDAAALAKDPSAAVTAYPIPRAPLAQEVKVGAQDSIQNIFQSEAQKPGFFGGLKQKFTDFIDNLGSTESIAPTTARAEPTFGEAPAEPLRSSAVVAQDTVLGDGAPSVGRNFDIPVSGTRPPTGPIVVETSGGGSGTVPPTPGGTSGPVFSPTVAREGGATEGSALSGAAQGLYNGAKSVAGFCFGWVRTPVCAGAGYFIFKNRPSVPSGLGASDTSASGAVVGAGSGTSKAIVPTGAAAPVNADKIPAGGLPKLTLEGVQRAVVGTGGQTQLPPQPLPEQPQHVLRGSGGNILSAIGSFFSGMLSGLSGKTSPSTSVPAATPAATATPTTPATAQIKPSVAFVSNPSTIKSGDTAQLSWAAVGSTECTVTADDKDKTVISKGANQNTFTTKPLTQTTVFNIECKGGTTPPVTGQVTVTVQ